MRRCVAVFAAVAGLLLGATPALATAPGYTLSRTSTGTLLRWNPCAAIHWRVNLAQAPKGVGVLADVKAAIARVHAATGMTFVYDGPTSVIPQQGYGQSASPGHPLPLVIAWARPGAVRGGSTLLPAADDGFGGYAWQSWTIAGVAHAPRIVSGFAVLNSATRTPYTAGFGRGVTRGELLLHELGHAMGLMHVADPRQIMYPRILVRAKAAYGSGDLAGLRRVGRAAGCIP